MASEVLSQGEGSPCGAAGSSLPSAAQESTADAFAARAHCQNGSWISVNRSASCQDLHKVLWWQHAAGQGGFHMPENSTKEWRERHFMRLRTHSATFSYHSNLPSVSAEENNFYIRIKNNVQKKKLRCWIKVCVATPVTGIENSPGFTSALNSRSSAFSYTAAEQHYCSARVMTIQDSVLIHLFSICLSFPKYIEKIPWSIFELTLNKKTLSSYYMWDLDYCGGFGGNFCGGFGGNFVVELLFSSP